MGKVERVAKDVTLPGLGDGWDIEIETDDDDEKKKTG